MSTCSPACSGKTPICSDLNKCVQCLNDAQCTGDTRVCAPDSTCVECTQDNQAYCISSSGVSGFCQNNVCIDGASCTRPTTGKDISVCSKPNACCFNELTGGLQPCSLDPNMIGFSGGRCIIIADDPSKTGDWCRTSYDSPLDRTRAPSSRSPPSAVRSCCCLPIRLRAASPSPLASSRH